MPPSGELWLHEIKHDGFRVIARKRGTRAKLYSRAGNDLTYRFPRIVEALAYLRSQSCIIDGEPGPSVPQYRMDLRWTVQLSGSSCARCVQEFRSSVSV
jgi:ATP-dependent DNA ligase